MKTRNILSAAKKKNYVIEVSELLVGYNQGTVCGELNFEVEAGDVLSLIGANGVGKTTVLKALIGLLEPEEGAVKLFGRRSTTGSCGSGATWRASWTRTPSSRRCRWPST